mmetsp:Transcript_75992/g.148889  ORF Transcript_75992/g.148889 Transcript_75992/m.148889 type:complete len:242 (+) Transcript_75992:42-767(+)
MAGCGRGLLGFGSRWSCGRHHRRGDVLPLGPHFSLFKRARRRGHAQRAAEALRAGGEPGGRGVLHQPAGVGLDGRELVAVGGLGGGGWGGRAGHRVFSHDGHLRVRGVRRGELPHGGGAAVWGGHGRARGQRAQSRHGRRLFPRLPETRVACVCRGGGLEPWRPHRCHAQIGEEPQPCKAPPSSLFCPGFNITSHLTVTTFIIVAAFILPPRILPRLRISSSWCLQRKWRVWGSKIRWREI